MLSDIKSLDMVYIALFFVIPGMVITYIRERFITGRVVSVKDGVISFFALSILYYGAAFPAVDLLFSSGISGWAKYISWISLVFVGPSLVGLLLGMSVRKGWIRKVFGHFNINPVHVIPTGWDYVFGINEQRYVLVTMNDDTKFGGFYSTNSFASSEQSCRDLYLEKVFEIPSDDSPWIECYGKSLWLNGAQIRSVEFYNVEE